MPEILIGKNLALESLQKAPLSPASRMIAKLAIDSVPVADAEPVRHGRWMFLEQKRGYLWKCSNCKGNFEQRFSYCPYCGAKMDGGDDNG